MRPEQNTKKIDFKTLSKDELKALADQLQTEAEGLEKKIERQFSYGNDPERLERLWFSANSVWRKVKALEAHRLNKGTLKVV